MSATEQTTALGGAAGVAGRLLDQRARPEVFGRRQREVWLVAVVIAALVPLVVHGAYGYNLALNACLYAILAVGFFYQFVLAGQFSFATPTYYAVGAYVYIWASRNLDGFLVGIIVATLVTAVMGAATKLILARSPLIHFSIATLAFGSLGIIVLQNWHSFTGGDQGLYGVAVPKLFGYSFQTPTKQYVLVVAVLLLGIGLALLYQRSASQRDTVFVRDMGPVARTVGLRSLRIQATNFGVGAGYMGAAGSLYASTAGFVTTAGFDISIALQVLVMVLVGGIGSVWGAVIGAVAVYELQSQALQSLNNYQDLIYAVLILGVILVLPGGLVSLPKVIGSQLQRRSRR